MELPNNMRAMISSCGNAGVELKLISGFWPVPRILTRTVVPSTSLAAATRIEGLLAGPPLNEMRPLSSSKDRPAKPSVPRTSSISPAIKGASLVPVTRNFAPHSDSSPMPLTYNLSGASSRILSFQLLGSLLIGSASPDTRARMVGVLRRIPDSVATLAAPWRIILNRVSGRRRVPLIRAAPSGVLVTLICPVAVDEISALRATRARSRSRLSCTGKPLSALKLTIPLPVTVPSPAFALSSVTSNWSLVKTPRTRNSVNLVP